MKAPGTPISFLIGDPQLPLLASLGPVREVSALDLWPAIPVQAEQLELA